MATQWIPEHMRSVVGPNSRTRNRTKGLNGINICSRKEFARRPTKPCPPTGKAYAGHLSIACFGGIVGEVTWLQVHQISAVTCPIS